MQQIRGKKYRAVVLHGDRMGMAAPVVDDQIAAVEGARPAVHIVNARDSSPPIPTAMGVGMSIEVRSIVVRVDVQLDFRRR